jgi:biopolymer transport protein ExbD
MNKTAKNSAVPYINVTPLIDVLLVLLIIFMVISPAKPSRYESRIPEKPADDQPVTAPDDTLVVSVSASKGYRLNHLELRSLAELNERLHTALDGRPSDRKAVFIKAAPALPYSDVVSVIDVVKESGGAPVGLQLEGLN